MLNKESLQIMVSGAFRSARHVHGSDTNDSSRAKRVTGAIWGALTNSHDSLYPGCKVAVDGTYAALRKARAALADLDCGCGISGCQNMQRKCLRCENEILRTRVAKLEKELTRLGGDL